MRIIKKIFFILITVITTIFNQSCGSSEIKDDTLSSFMLGGIYFIKGYGGNDITRSMIRESGYISNKEIIKGYKELFEFPFTISQKSNISSFLEERWEINDQASLLKTIELLKTQDSEHKAWDYALLVNNVAMGYAAEYITKEEGISIVKEILPLAREK